MSSVQADRFSTIRDKVLAGERLSSDDVLYLYSR
jgi:hypothetical protein